MPSCPLFRTPDGDSGHFRKSRPGQTLLFATSFRHAVMKPLRNPRPLVDLLVEQHGLLRRALTLLGRMARRTVSGEHPVPGEIRALLRLLHALGEAHQGEQEQDLFPWLSRRGLPSISGPLIVLRMEHRLAHEGRLALELDARALLASSGGVEERTRFYGRALKLVEQWTAHLNKEEQALYPLCAGIPAGSGEAVTGNDLLPARVRTRIAALESGPVGAWPEPEITLHGLGTPEAFARLCREAMGEAGSGGPGRPGFRRAVGQ